MATDLPTAYKTKIAITRTRTRRRRIPRNAYGTVTSSTAHLIVNPAGVSLGMYAGLTIDGSTGKTYAIQFSTNFISWVTLTNVTLTDPVLLWVDTNINVSAPGHVSGSYRVQAVP